MSTVVIGNVDAPNGGMSGGETICRTDSAAPNGSLVTQVRINKYQATSGSAVGKVKRLTVNGSNYDITDIASFTVTSGTGVQTITISPGYRIPETGTHYVGIWLPADSSANYMGYVSGGTHPYLYKAGEATGTNVAITEYFDQSWCVEVTYTVSAPTVDTVNMTNVGATTAIGNGLLWYSGGATVTDKGICWKTSSGPTTADNKASYDSVLGQYFTATLTGLTSGQIYYVKAYAINSEGTSYGSEITFIPYSPPSGGGVGGQASGHSPRAWSGGGA